MDEQLTRKVVKENARTSLMREDNTTCATKAQYFQPARARQTAAALAATTANVSIAETANCRIWRLSSASGCVAKLLQNIPAPMTALMPLSSDCP